MLYQIAQHDGMLPAGQADKAIARTSRAEVHHYRMDHFGPFSPEHHLTVEPTPATSSAASTTPGCKPFVTGAPVRPMQPAGVFSNRRRNPTGAGSAELG